jgi:hypothetical protein
MKKLMISIFAAVAILPIAVLAAFAAPEEAPMAHVGPYEGTFHGTVYGDSGSSAPLTLELTHRDDIVSGNMYIGSGLYVKGGVCGGANVPAASQYASGKTVRNNPQRLVASSKVDVGRFDINVKLQSDVLADGDTINATAKLDLPWLCGRDPVLNATLYRAN